MDHAGPRASTFAAVSGVAMGIFGLLTTFWIPTLAAMFAVGALVSGFTQIRNASTTRRSLAGLAIALGIGVVLLIVVILLRTSGSSSGNAVDVMVAP